MSDRPSFPRPDTPGQRNDGAPDPPYRLPTPPPPPRPKK